MAGKRKFAFSRELLKWILLIPTFLNVVTHITSVMGLEVRRAANGLIPLAILTICLGTLFTITWLCLFVLLGIYLMSIQLTLAWTVTIILLLNLLIMIVMSYFIAKLKHRFIFPRTAQICRSLYEMIDL